MSESQMQPGWYYAQGDAPGTQRYWDGTQWVGGPQAVAQGQDNVAVATAGGGVPAEWGQRFVAWLIDAGIQLGIYIVVLILTAIVATASDSLGGILSLIGSLGLFAFQIWNFVIRQGQIGQTLGKTQQNIKLVRDDTGQPVGPGMAFVRWLVAGLIAVFTCGIGGLLDVLWPLWDDQNKRLTDKILNFSVINA